MSEPKAFDLELRLLGVLPDLVAYYLDHYPSGHNLHIVLADGNVTDDNLFSCQEQCQKESDLLGLLIATTLRFIPEESREIVIDKGNKILKKGWRSVV